MDLNKPAGERFIFVQIFDFSLGMQIPGDLVNGIGNDPLHWREVFLTQESGNQQIPLLVVGARLLLIEKCHVTSFFLTMYVHIKSKLLDVPMLDLSLLAYLYEPSVAPFMMFVWKIR